MQIFFMFISWTKYHVSNDIVPLCPLLLRPIHTVIIFIFFVLKKSHKITGWTTDVHMDYFNDVPNYVSGPWTVSVSLLPMQDQKALRFYQNILTFVLKVLRLWNDMRVSN